MSNFDPNVERQMQELGRYMHKLFDAGATRAQGLSKLAEMGFDPKTATMIVDIAIDVRNKKAAEAQNQAVSSVTPEVQKIVNELFSYANQLLDMGETRDQVKNKMIQRGCSAEGVDLILTSVIEFREKRRIEEAAIDHLHDYTNQLLDKGETVDQVTTKLVELGRDSQTATLIVNRVLEFRARKPAIKRALEDLFDYLAFRRFVAR